MKIALMSFSLVAALTASARPVDHAPALLQLLRGIDTVPTAADLTKASGVDPAGALYRVALDGDVGLYERRRAASLLSAFPGPLTETYLQVLGRAMPEAPLRWIAVFTFCRTFGPTAPDRVTTFAKTVLGSTEPLDREAAVRGLRYVQGAAATALLDTAWSKETDKSVRAAIERVRTHR